MSVVAAKASTFDAHTDNPTVVACAWGLLCTENPQLGWGFRKAFSFEPVIKTPFDLLKHLAVWQLQVSNK
ncbi:hypothetical protein GRW30_19640, partial [Escherichia coli]|uniref:hypothetical protein n=1 Tax=Escherichia coli TaxID=562 RepID=UPI001302E8FD